MMRSRWYARFASVALAVQMLVIAPAGGDPAKLAAGDAFATV